MLCTLLLLLAQKVPWTSKCIHDHITDMFKILWNNILLTQQIFHKQFCRPHIICTHYIVIPCIIVNSCYILIQQLTFSTFSINFKLTCQGSKIASGNLSIQIPQLETYTVIMLARGFSLKRGRAC